MDTRQCARKWARDCEKSSFSRMKNEVWRSNRIFVYFKFRIIQNFVRIHFRFFVSDFEQFSRSSNVLLANLQWAYNFEFSIVRIWIPNAIPQRTFTEQNDCDDPLQARARIHGAR